MNVATSVNASNGHQEAEETLRASEDRFRSIFDHSNDAIFVIDPALDSIVDVNPSACKMLGYPREEGLHVPASAFLPSRRV